MYGKLFEEFKVGCVYNHFPGKTITESDNNFFSLLTMNHHPIHLDFEYAKKSQHRKILVVGTYVFSLVVGMTVADISGAAIANLEYEKVEHNAPTYIGDTIHAQTKVLEARESQSKNDRGIVYVETTAYNQHDIKVLTFRRRILVPKRKAT